MRNKIIICFAATSSSVLFVPTAFRFSCPFRWFFWRLRSFPTSWIGLSFCTTTHLHRLWIFKSSSRSGCCCCSGFCHSSWISFPSLAEIRFQRAASCFISPLFLWTLHTLLGLSPHHLSWLSDVLFTLASLGSHNFCELALISFLSWFC